MLIEDVATIAEESIIGRYLFVLRRFDVTDPGS
jgi:hypothetical protein